MGLGFAKLVMFVFPDGDEAVAGLGTEGGGVKHCSEKLGLRLITPGALVMGLGTVSWAGNWTGLMS